MVRLNSKIHNSENSLFFWLIITRSGLLVGIRRSVYISKSQKILYFSFFRTDSSLSIYHSVVGSNFNLFHNSQWITFPSQSCLVLYSFRASLLLSHIMWLIVLSLLPHNLFLLFWCVWSIFALTYLVLMELFYAASRKDSVILLKFLFLSRLLVWDFISL